MSNQETYLNKKYPCGLISKSNMKKELLIDDMPRADSEDFYSIGDAAELVN